MIKEINRKLFTAASRGDIRGLKRALKMGASLRAKNENKMTALDIAAHEGLREVIECLLEHRAKVTNEAIAAAELSEKSGIEIVKLLQIAQMRQSRPSTKYNSTVDSRLLNAACDGDLAKAKKALAKHGDPDAIDGLDTSALRWAARFSHPHIVEELVKAGAKINLQSKTGWTVLMEAIVAGSTEIVEFLINHGADVNARTFVNASPLYFAEERGIPEIIKLLKKNSAELHHPGS